MAIIAGIDEAGYGPILGPLVVSVAAFEVPDEALERCLWRTLRRSVSSAVRKRERRLTIVDSKKLYTPEAGLAALERTALTMLEVCGQRPEDGRSLLRGLCASALQDLSSYPWYEGLDLGLPIEADRAMIKIKARAVSADLAGAGMRFLGAASRLLPEGHFNRLVSRTRNKASVLWGQATQLIEHALEIGCPQTVRVCLDRQGARVHCAQALMTAFEPVALEVVAESPLRSAYRLRRRIPGGGEHGVLIEFVQSGEAEHLPIALASILSKYLREVCMLAFNRYWQRHVDALKRTAGYYQDGLRFLRDIEPALRLLAVDRGMLVRSR